MVFDLQYWTSVLKKVIYISLLLVGIILTLNLSVFYMPFLIAFIISVIIEPLIKFIMKHTNWTRRTSSILIFTIVAVVIFGGLTWAIFTLVSEASNLLQGLNEYFDKAYKIFGDFSNSFSFDNIHISDELKAVLGNSTSTFFETLSIWVRDFLNGLINMITSIPVIAIYFGITVVALYFICVDRIYIIDQVEHHLPKLWVRKLGRHFRELVKTLGNYLKAEVTLVFVSFMISLIGLYILMFMGFDIKYPLLMAIFIGFVDALPILRVRNSYDTMGGIMCY